ncbi:putative cytosol aminopeptidase [Candidatus Hydrogenisulfobacillus filiaventi]|uniref:Probable cytosol aminopeptidase n=1 Tax=Candidatus Hydrogenisulfobacillus filiaventi TaxID=2707344 RepID=A0A6F8ZGI8_9FIRM|nr:leucyl aminopeptidase [Bacillota bacterium]CAB1128868.1 putative cytosol aminopeptidase [Candidatus Hydrogenisulfobacillus filiaventi]
MVEHSAELTVSEVYGSPLKQPADVLVLPLYEGEGLEGWAAEVDGHLNGALSEALSREEASAAPERVWIAPAAGRLTARRVCTLGLGKRAAVSAQGLRRAMGRLIQEAERVRAQNLVIAVPDTGLGWELVGEAVAEGLHLGAWRFPGYHQAPKPRTLPAVNLCLEAEEPLFSRGLARGTAVARAQNLARALGAMPSNYLYPERLAEEAREAAAQAGLEAEVLDEVRLRELGMGAILGVGQGSAYPPRMVILRYRGGQGGKTLALVGKGITFDSGGISIKPSQGMEEMKYDMLGAAAVLGAMVALAADRPPIDVIGIMAIAQNIPSGTSYKPGDVLTAFNGKTIEILNTDAEGRVVLADAVSYAVHLGADWIVEASTLTGAALIVLGHEATPMVATDDHLADVVLAAGERAGERIWRLPAYPEYRELYKSAIADLKNAPGRDAGTITGGLIVAEFAGNVPFVHLDIAGTAWTKEGPLNAEAGPTGVGVRTFVETARLLAE